MQVYDPVFGFAWFAHPAVLVTQLTVEHGTQQLARHVHDVIDHVLEHARAEVRSSGGLYIIHDFRSMTGYDKEGRVEFLQRMRRRGSGYSRGAAVAFQMDRPLLKMAVQGANLVSALSVKAPLVMVEDPRSIVESEIRLPPLPGEPFPGLETSGR